MFLRQSERLRDAFRKRATGGSRLRATRPRPGPALPRHVLRSLSFSYQSVLGKTASRRHDVVPSLIYREAGRLGDKFSPWRVNVDAETLRFLPLIPGLARCGTCPVRVTQFRPASFTDIAES